MDISAGLIAKAVGGTAAVAAASGTSYAFREEIGSFLFGPHLSEEIKQANEKLDSLGIPNDCRFGAEWSFSVCNSLDVNKLSAIKFEGKTEGQSVTLSGDKKPSLKVEKLTDVSFFTNGLKFIFFNEGDVNIPASQQITLKANTNTEFKIKTGSDNSLTLERAWDVTELAKKVGLTCPKEAGSTECSLAADGLSVLEEENRKATSLTLKSPSGSGKIKFEGDQKGYNQGFKLHIEEGNVGLNGGDTSSIAELKEFATYEIKEHNEGNEKKWYLIRKASASKRIAKILNLPDGCVLPTGGNNSKKDCTINNKKDLKEINFDGKGTGDLSVNDSISVTLKIQKETGTDYPLGYKFIFKADATAINIPKNGGEQITIGTSDTEFKIKKVNNNLTLEKKNN